MNLRDCLVRHGIVDSKRVCRLPLAAQLFFRNLLHTCDGAGRFIADADDLRTTLYRHALDRVSKRHVTSWLALCHTAVLVRLYTGPDGCGYGEVLNYGQRDTKRRVLHPAREEDQLPLGPPETPAQKKPAPKKLNRREEEGESARGAPQSTSPPVSFSVEALQSRWPAVDIARELERALKRKRDKEGPKATVDIPWFEKHWLPFCGPAYSGNTQPGGGLETIPEPEGWRAWLNNECPGSAYAHGGDEEGTPWAQLDATVRRHIAQSMKGAA